jgi:uncharacterized glyoxalase superfamily protein PhnB
MVPFQQNAKGLKRSSYCWRISKNATLTRCFLDAYAGQATQSLYVHVHDVDAHFVRARRVGATILEVPKSTLDGHRRRGAEDPEGHQWYPAQEIAKRAKPKKRRSSSS